MRECFQNNADSTLFIRVQHLHQRESAANRSAGDLGSSQNPDEGDHPAGLFAIAAVGVEQR